MREKIQGKLHSEYTVIRTSTGDKDFHYQFREAAHIPARTRVIRSMDPVETGPNRDLHHF